MREVQKFRFRSLRLLILYVGVALLHIANGFVLEMLMLLLLAVLIAGQSVQLGHPLEQVVANLRKGKEEMDDVNEELSEDKKKMLMMANGNLNVLLVLVVVALGRLFSEIL